jgi:hypothetical protein
MKVQMVNAKRKLILVEIKIILIVIALNIMKRVITIGRVSLVLLKLIVKIKKELIKEVFNLINLV